MTNLGSPEYSPAGRDPVDDPLLGDLRVVATTGQPGPAAGEFCHRHFSWLCQAGQGQCQRSNATPRVWLVAEQPGREVLKVRDIDLDPWLRNVSDGPSELDTWSPVGEPDTELPWPSLLGEFGPLTEELGLPSLSGHGAAMVSPAVAVGGEADPGLSRSGSADPLDEREGAAS